MAITQAICDSFKEELLEGTHDLDGHTLKMALYTSSATLGSTTTAYSTTNESSGTSYTAGGETISSVTVTKSTSIRATSILLSFSITAYFLRLVSAIDFLPL